MFHWSATYLLTLSAKISLFLVHQMLVRCGCLDTVVVTCGNLKLSHCNDRMHASNWLALIWFRCFQKYLSANHFPPSRSQLQNLFSPGWPVERYESMHDEDVAIATAYVKQVECVNNAPWVTCPPRLYWLLEIWIDSKGSCIFAAALRFLFFYQTGRIFRKLECWLMGERANIFASFYQKIHVSGVINNKIPQMHCKEPFICLSRIHDGVYTCLPRFERVARKTFDGWRHWQWLFSQWVQWLVSGGMLVALENHGR